MTRRRLLMALARILTAWVLLTVQGVCDTAHLAALGFVPAGAPLACALPAPAEAETTHTALCRCSTCRGPKHCCCAKAKSETQSTAFRAVCDTPIEQHLPGVVGPVRALPPTTVFVTAHWQTAPTAAAPPRLVGYRPRFPEPSTPPPTV